MLIIKFLKDLYRNELETPFLPLLSHPLTSVNPKGHVCMTLVAGDQRPRWHHTGGNWIMENLLLDLLQIIVIHGVNADSLTSRKIS